MTFYDLTFPATGNWGSTSEPRFSTTVVEMPSGARERISRWSGSARVFNVTHDVQSYAEVKAIYDFFMSVRGAGNTFRFKDWHDYSSNPACLVDSYAAPTVTDQTLGVADGNTYTYQITKTYTAGLNTLTRNIYLVKPGTLVLSINGVTYTTGFTVNTTAGTVTFTYKPGTSSGLGGTGVLGMEIKVGFEFDCHVAFDVSVDKALQIAMDRFGAASMPNIVLVEEVDSVPIYDAMNHGGASYQTMSASLELTTAMGKFVRLAPTTSGLALHLPLVSGYAEGGDYFTLQNTSGSYSLDVQYLGSSLGTLAASGWMDVFLGYDDAGVLVWQARS